MSARMFCLVATVFSQVLLSSAEVRPVWNIGHMVNSLWQVDQFLNLGANALETDFSFLSNGTAIWTYHGSPCDCFRRCRQYESIDNYLSYIRQLTSPDSPKFRSNFVLLQIDLKISSLSDYAKYEAGIDVANKIIYYLWKGKTRESQLWLLFSIPLTTDSVFIKGFMKTLIDREYEYVLYKIGWDISGNENLEFIKAAHQNLQTTRVWQSDGITNCLPRSIKRLIAAIEKRDSDPEWEFLSKVYYWTLDKKSTMKYALRLGVDGIITNHPDRFVAVLNEEFFNSHRLANIKDNPWEKIKNINTQFAQIKIDENYIFNESEIEEEDT